MSSLEEQFRDFVGAAMRIGASMLDGATPDQVARLDGALKAGARLSLELSPLPAFERLALVLVEREGMRHQLVSVEVNEGPMQ